MTPAQELRRLRRRLAHVEQAIAALSQIEREERRCCNTPRQFDNLLTLPASIQKASRQSKNPPRLTSHKILFFPVEKNGSDAPPEEGLIPIEATTRH